ncbi:MAG: primosomal protein N' [Dehalococcoidia bacterium]|nr:primosomal protein N' [Dehalococcoidia bacterium]MCB9484988.1 primosomal protein N' [Thermoflexaceae bacterium]
MSTMEETGSKSQALPFAQVAVNAGQPTRRAFTYAVPAALDRVVPGQAVFVPYGPRVLQGVVLERTAASEIDDVRPLTAVADDAVVLDATHISLARWMSGEYLAPLWECIATCLPNGYGQKAVTMVSPVDIPPLLPVYPEDQKILAYLARHGRTPLDTLRATVRGATTLRLQRLQRDGHLTVVQGLARPAGHVKLQRRVKRLRSAAETAAEATRLAAERPNAVAARLLRLLEADGDRPLADLREAGATVRLMGQLSEGGWLEQYEAQVTRDPLRDYAFERRPPPELTPEQAAAADRMKPGGAYLLHGVTGAGKTEVYLTLVQRALERGEGAIVLVPEIALTPQAIRRYGERFGDTLAVFHSGLGAGELYDEWWRTKRGDARVIIGSRSAVFAPVGSLGLVILDEEHEWTYKQVDPQPRYHAREAARELCRLTGATLVLGSATPDVVTYYGSETGEFERVELRERVVATPTGELMAGRHAQTKIVDMREELRTGNRSIFSRALGRAIRTSLERGEQSILFVNRRGAARFMLCRACGHVPLCPACELAMSLDQAGTVHARLRCHHCGRERRLEDGCPSCGSGKYRPFGVGTQRVEAEARKEFPRARVARWDSDVASRKGAHERIVQALEAREIDVLVGTQLLAKGLDLPQMTVVGVVDADVGLSLPEFHAHERAFQLLSQVSGRAGRREREGFVFIQTYEPEAPPIVAAAAHGYRSFYEHEIAHRRRAGYPPFSRLVRLLHRGRDEAAALKEATRVAADLRMERDVMGAPEPDVLGPTPAFIARVRGEYRWQILLRGRAPGRLVERIRLGDRWAIDVDPASLL